MGWGGVGWVVRVGGVGCGVVGYGSVGKDKVK